LSSFPASLTSFWQTPNPNALLHELLRTVDHTLASATSILPYLPSKQQRQQVEAVVEEVREEGEVVGMGVRERLERKA
jgi:hypothetical protein